MSSYARMRAPERCSGFAHQGFAMKPERDGTFLVDRRHIAEYTAHGFVPADEAPQTAESLAAQRVFAADPRPAAEPMPPVAAGLEPGTVAFLNRMSAKPGALERLAALIEGDMQPPGDARAVPPTPITDPPTPVDPVKADRLTEAQVEAMTQPQLTAWCKARDIPIERPIDVDVLRAKVLAAQARE